MVANTQYLRKIEDGKSASERLKAEKEAIIKQWMARAREVSEISRALDEKTLVDSLPDFLENLSDALVDGEFQRNVRESSELGREHGRQRANIQGFLIDYVLLEYRILRRVIFSRLREGAHLSPHVEDAINDAVDRGIGNCSAEFVRLRTERQMEVARGFREQEEWLEAALNLIPVPILFIDAQSSQTTFKNAAAHLLRMPLFDRLEEVTERRFATDRVGRRIEMANMPRSRVARGESVRGFELVWHTEEGSVPLVVSAELLPELHGRPPTIVMVLRDLTELRAAQRESESLLLEVQSAHEKEVGIRKSLEVERDLRERFVTTLTHDLRNPLTSAKANTQMIIRHPDQSERHAHLAAKILASLDRIDRMTSDLLDANRIQAGQSIALTVTSIDLAQLLEQIVDEQRIVNGDRFEIELLGSLRGVWDESALRRVFENLLSNAVKYGEPGSPITLRARGEPERVVISVNNRGTPLSTDDQASLFQPYRRTQSAEKSGKESWGIGLTLVRGLIDAHQGRVWVESSDRQGTTFYVELPRVERSRGD